jgi:hypothetical protein
MLAALLTGEYLVLKEFADLGEYAPGHKVAMRVVFWLGVPVFLRCLYFVGKIVSMDLTADEKLPEPDDQRHNLSKAYRWLSFFALTVGALAGIANIGRL